MQRIKYFYPTIGIVLADQVIKLLVHFNMVMGVGGEIKVFGNWFKLHYILNDGMAFGLNLGSEYGKLSLTLFRLMACVFIAMMLHRMVDKAYTQGLLGSIALILGGAIGNVIDSVFYGVLLDNAPYDAITPWFHGQVIDMFYVDMWEGYIADWIPIWGGKRMALWPIFNLADVSIFVGVFNILVFQRSIFKRSS